MGVFVDDFSPVWTILGSTRKPSMGAMTSLVALLLQPAHAFPGRSEAIGAKLAQAGRGLPPFTASQHQAEATAATCPHQVSRLPSLL